MKKLISLLLLFSLTITANAIGYIGNLEPVKLYTIDTPYEYPIVPGTPEWLKLEDNIAMINACAIPESIASHMTTDALLESFLNHPMRENLFAFDDYNTGFAVLQDYYKMGINELLSRDDLAETILNKYNEIEVFNGVLPVALSKSEEEAVLNQKVKDSFSMMVMEILSANMELNNSNPDHIALKNALFNKYEAKKSNADFYGPASECYYIASLSNGDITPLANYDFYIETPNGTPVLMMYVEQDHTQSHKDYLHDYYDTEYQYAERIGNATLYYNCHSYAWYNASTSNRYQMWDPTPFMEDGSYINSPSARVGAKIYYHFPNHDNGIHSGIVSSIPATVYVKSKWGDAGLYEHAYQHCPYYFTSGGSITYWYR